jgi:UDP-N-acetylglucosamine 2-epimerase
LQRKIAIIVGTRPEIIKMQPIVKELKARKTFDSLFVHSGQHYDSNMSKIFIDQLDLPSIDISLDVKSNSPNIQVSRIISRFQQRLSNQKLDMILVLGDTNTAFACAVAASKLKIPVGHIEAGCRSFDRTMPEEINRVAIADLAEYHFAPTQSCVNNLSNEGIRIDRIFFTGHPIVDVLHQIENKISLKILEQFGVIEREYCFATIHREANIANRLRLQEILESFSRISQTSKIVFPIHPHTKKLIQKYRLEKFLTSMKTIAPIGYLETLGLIKNAKKIFTDSGGIQQESAMLKTPCITIRPNTEWVETVECGVNFLADTKENIVAASEKIDQNYKKIEQKFSCAEGIFGRPGVSKRIVDILDFSAT